MRLLLFTNFFLSFHKDLLLRIDLSFPTFLPIKNKVLLFFRDRIVVALTLLRLDFYRTAVAQKPEQLLCPLS